MKALFKNQTIQQWLVFLFLAQITWGCFYEFAPVVGKNSFQMSAKMVGIFMGWVAFSLMLSTGVLIPFCQRFFSKQRLVYLALLFLTLGALLALLASAYAQLDWARLIFWLSAFPIAFGDVLFFVILVGFLSHQVGVDQRGKLMGVIYIVGMGAWSMMGFLGGYLTQSFKNGAFMIMPVGVFVLLIWMFRHPKKIKVLAF